MDLHVGEVWLGSIGNLVRLHHVSALAISPNRPSSEFRTMTGRRRMQHAPTGARSWAVEAPGLYPSELGQFVHLVEASPGPHAWVDPVARVVNLLPPPASRWAPGTWVTDAGANAPAPDGVVTWDEAGIGKSRGEAGIAVTATGRIRCVHKIPLVPDVPVTGSVIAFPNLAAGSAQERVSLEFFSGAALTRTVSAAVPQVAAARAVVSSVAAAGEDSCQLAVSSSAATRWVRPAVTWTPQVRDWGDGMGVVSVDVILGDRVPRTAWITGPSSSSKLSFQVMEVG